MVFPIIIDLVFAIFFIMQLLDMIFGNAIIFIFSVGKYKFSKSKRLAQTT